MFGGSIISNNVDIFMGWYLEKFINHNFIVLIFFKRKFSYNSVRLYTGSPNCYVIYITYSIITNSVLFNILHICMMQYFDVISNKPVCNMCLNFRIKC